MFCPRFVTVREILVFLCDDVVYSNAVQTKLKKINHAPVRINGLFI